MKTYDPLAGTHITTACKEAVRLAKESGDAVAFSFNGVDLVAMPDNTPEGLEHAWDIGMEANSRAYWTPERLEEKSRKEAADCLRLNEHIAILPHIDWRDANAVCRWLCEFESRAFTHTPIDTAAILRTFAEHGYHPGENLKNAGESQEAWRARVGRDGAMRWVIGQALDGTRSVGCPHGMIHTFYEQLVSE